MLYVCVQRRGVVQQFPAFRSRGLGIQEGETKITKPLGVINGGMCWELMLTVETGERMLRRSAPDL